MNPFTVALIVLAVLGILASLQALRGDPPRQAPRSHAVDPDLLPPASRVARS